MVEFRTAAINRAQISNIFILTNCSLSADAMDCYICGKTFSRKDALERHVTSGKCGGKKLNEFKCMDCPCAYTSKRRLQQHRAKQHPPGFTNARKELPGGTLQCAKCSLPFKSPHELAKHDVRCGRAKDVREKRDARTVRENGASDGFDTVSSALCVVQL